MLPQGIYHPYVSLPHFDLTEWDFWWEFNKDAYLVRRNPPPALEQILEVVVPALVRGLGETGVPEIPSACLIALARIGQVRDLEKILKKYRAHPVQMISETAVIASGIAASTESLPDLLRLFENAPPGPELVWDAPRIDLRTRCFAGYALGLIAGASQETAVKRTVYEAAKGVLGNAGRFVERDLPVAAINAMRILDPGLACPEGAALAVEASRCLLDYLKDEQNRCQVRAHVPTAVAGLLGRDPVGPAKGIEPEDLAKSPMDQVAALRSEAIRLFCQMLHQKGENGMVVQSCVLALGQMAHSGDMTVFRILDQAASGDISRDFQVRSFAIISLGSLGGEEARSNLIARLGRPGEMRRKPWIALALAILAAERASTCGAADPEIGQALTNMLEKMKNPYWQAGIAVAVGMARHQEAGPKILDLMNKHRNPMARGYYAVGLGLMGFRGAIDDMRSLLDRSILMPDLLKQVAIGLGLMGDPSAMPGLVQALAATKAEAALASAALGLGLIGSPGSLEPLVEILEGHERFSNRTRAFAAAALGRLCDRSARPWNARIGVGLNYRAFVETLTGEGLGLLDLL